MHRLLLAVDFEEEEEMPNPFQTLERGRRKRAQLLMLKKGKPRPNGPSWAN